MEILEELKRCLGCKISPCAKACPLGVSPHDFIKTALADDYPTAAAQIASRNPLPQTCGLICPDTFCQRACIRAKIDKAIEIPCLQAYVMQRGGLPPLSLPSPNGKKVAIIGGGPAGLGALYEFIINGWKVDLYEKSSSLGGSIRLIPERRLPQTVRQKEINRLIDNDRVTVYLNTEITDWNKLKNNYDGMVIAIGETKTRNLNISGEENCLPYATYLSNPQQFRPQHQQKVAVIGGGEVALDCALTLKEQGFEQIEMFVRRQESDMRIMKRDHEELSHQNICIRALTSITKIEKNAGSYTLTTVSNQINEQGKAEHLMNTQKVENGYELLVMALGSYFPQEDLPTAIPCAGDMTGQCGTAVQALASGRKQARTVIEETLK